MAIKLIEGLEIGKNLRVAINTTSMLGQLTGVGQYTSALIGGLQKMPLELIFYRERAWQSAAMAPSVGDPQTTGQVSTRLGVKGRLVRQLATMPVLKSAFHSLHRHRDWQAIRNGIEQHKPDVYHEPNFVAPAIDVPTVITVHDLSCFRYPEYHPGERVRFMQKWLPVAIERAARIIAVSEFSKQEIVSYFGVSPDRISVILEAASPDFGPREDRQLIERLGLTPRSYFLFVGSLEPRKNLGLVLDAYAMLPSRIRNMHSLVLVGAEGWRREYFQSRLSGLLETGQVRELGYVPRSMLPVLYSSCAGFIFPSCYEGFGLPPLEAMACGAPVVVSSKASLPEVVGDAAALVSGDDADELMQVMRRLVEDRAWSAALGGASLSRAAQFSWQRAAEETFFAYQRAIFGTGSIDFHSAQDIA